MSYGNDGDDEYEDGYEDDDVLFPSCRFCAVVDTWGAGGPPEWDRIAHQVRSFSFFFVVNYRDILDHSTPGQIFCFKLTRYFGWASLL